MRTSPEPPPPRGISALVCTHNGSATIARALGALQAQAGLDGIPFEVIVVDNASTDDTAARATAAWTGSSIPFRLVAEPRPGLAFAREAGRRAARHSLLCWVDDDNFLAPDYLSRGLGWMDRHPRAALCGGCGVALLAEEPPPWFAREGPSFALGPQGEGEGDGLVPDRRGYVYGAAAIVRRAALDELHGLGFTSLLSGRSGSRLSAGEDTEICYALRLLGWQLIHSEQLLFQHALPARRLTWDYCGRLFEGFGQAEAILGLYRSQLAPGPGWRPWLSPLLPHLFLRQQRRRAAREAARYSAPTEVEGDRQYLLAHYFAGRHDALQALRRSGDLARHFARVRRFARRARRLRQARARQRL